ncbi:Clp protease N-terminal domain-containing protein [Streptomyces sp. NPDC058417]|uniref:Clp protease N-terminal domain-containing protein n=1 Tax=unclassified Streptomyces TaxID=2593676 RepID=UPI003653FBAC
MRPQIPRQPVPGHAAPAPDDEAGLSAELAAAVAGARRRAVRDGDRQTDTAHLLHSLLEHDPEVRDAFGEGPQLARLLGYLVQRSIGYGLRWQGGVEDSGALPVVAAAEGFSPLAAQALRHARDRAAERAEHLHGVRPYDGPPHPGDPEAGDVRARGMDLLAAIVADPQARAVEVLTRAGIDLPAVLPPWEPVAHQERPGRDRTS